MSYMSLYNHDCIKKRIYINDPLESERHYRNWLVKILKKRDEYIKLLMSDYIEFREKLEKILKDVLQKDYDYFCPDTASCLIYEILAEIENMKK